MPALTLPFLMSKITTEAPINVGYTITLTEAAEELKARTTATGGGNQRILSQAIWKEPDAVRPELPKAGQICGQRFILDSYLLGRTVEA